MTTSREGPVGTFSTGRGHYLAVIFRTCDQWTSSARQRNTSLPPRDIPVQTQPDFYWSNGGMTAVPGDRRHATHAKAAPKDSTETGRNEYRFSSAFMICGDYNSNFLMQPVRWCHVLLCTFEHFVNEAEKLERSITPRKSITRSHKNPEGRTWKLKQSDLNMTFRLHSQARTRLTWYHPAFEASTRLPPLTTQKPAPPQSFPDLRDPHLLFVLQIPFIPCLQEAIEFLHLPAPPVGAMVTHRGTWATPSISLPEKESPIKIRVSHCSYSTSRSKTKPVLSDIWSRLLLDLIASTPPSTSLNTFLNFWGTRTDQKTDLSGDSQQTLSSATESAFFLYSRLESGLRFRLLHRLSFPLPPPPMRSEGPPRLSSSRLGMSDALGDSSSYTG